MTVEDASATSCSRRRLKDGERWDKEQTTGKTRIREGNRRRGLLKREDLKNKKDGTRVEEGYGERWDKEQTTGVGDKNMN
jgi:hypothetical protein